MNLCEVQAAFFDFDGVFTDNKVQVNSEGVETVTCWRSDGLGLAALVDQDVHVHVISTEKNPVVAKRCEKLNVAYSQGVVDKGAELLRLCDLYQVDVLKSIFVGNDTNDLSAFNTGVFRVCVSDSHNTIRNAADLILKTAGGFGAVREICDAIVDAKKVSHRSS